MFNFKANRANYYKAFRSWSTEFSLFSHREAVSLALTGSKSPPITVEELKTITLHIVAPRAVVSGFDVVRAENSFK